jgi:hypothetical protein
MLSLIASTRDANISRTKAAGWPADHCCGSYSTAAAATQQGNVAAANAANAVK